MRSIFLSSFLSITLMTAGAAGAPAQDTQAPPPFVLSIPGFEDGGEIPVDFSQAADGVAEGEGTSPEISWENPPEGTESFVLYMHDIDVVRDMTLEDQLHWLVWNIPADTTMLPEGVERGEQLEDGSYQTSATGPVYRGPGAPAAGPLHHYVFELYALDTSLDVEPVEDPFENRRAVLEAMDGHILGKATYVGLFKRPE
ncbi:YbhB/YbcL family Raf kinase inhibitor-like protein [Pelagibacterium sp. 26DY04]|uniref:YbhB/YbcL family Raf kinase inhibitor-like protein n=1 Tax=unclassified Pelagibacterium TaxID=2623280 RepID=UPI0028166D6F|nr:MULTISPECIES: YbhB/YbcL family Raf kinase inhibitor-like protein [unclassified Pelagibacterium]WMT85427.1 YbhB/YbcL family Raf kinase inhibitor-like protein [Pelagibacterium sp. 26DY04]WMT90267.1 YbhB/YbcL family Raf kinase inhibitor-like protein [Pelagibacterium sp. H642]